MLTDSEACYPNLGCDQEDDLSRSQSPLIPLTIENTIIDIKSEPQEQDGEDPEEEDMLNNSLTAMDWLPKLNAKAGVIEEEIPEEEKKPPHSYASLIRLAIMNSIDQRATLSDIYAWIQNQFIYYKNQTNPGWKNSIRHNLSLNKCFIKVARSRHDPGKGCYWAINHMYQHEKKGSFDKKRKSLLFPPELLNPKLQLPGEPGLIQALQNNANHQQEQMQHLLSHHLPQLQQQSEAELFLKLQAQLAAQQLSFPVQPQLLPGTTAAPSYHPFPSTLDSWATSSDADLSSALSGYCEKGISPESVLSMGTQALLDTELSMDGLDNCNQVKSFPEVKTEVESKADIERSNMPGKTSDHRELVESLPDEILGGTGFVKLPSLWAGLDGMSWQGIREQDDSDWLDMENAREVPEQNDEADDYLDNIDYDKLL